MHPGEYWFQLLHYWINVRKRNRLTIPFILGAKSVISSNLSIDRSEVLELFNQIMHSTGGEVFTLEHCGTVGNRTTKDLVKRGDLLVQLRNDKEFYQINFAMSNLNNA